MTEKITVDTQSFGVELNEDLMPVDIRVLDSKIAEFYESNQEAMTKGLIAELAMNLYLLKDMQEAVLNDHERMREQMEDVEDELQRYKTESEMLRDELDSN